MSASIQLLSFRRALKIDDDLSRLIVQKVKRRNSHGAFLNTKEQFISQIAAIWKDIPCVYELESLSNVLVSIGMILKLRSS